MRASMAIPADLFFDFVSFFFASLYICPRVDFSECGGR